MPAYVIAHVEVTDPERYQEYAKRTPGTIAQHGGRFLARGGEVATLEGPEETQRIAIVEFPSMAAAREWYASAEYRDVREFRGGAATVSLTLVDGC
jgi:uncharacterized protein (DUF1330 family)